MSHKIKAVISIVLFTGLGRAALGAPKKHNKTGDARAEITDRQPVPVLWREPHDLRSRNLFYGPGGRNDAPHTVFTFVEEDLDGTNPKFVVRDEDGTKWKVKMGLEARPETAASRLVWAVGYFANEDYFVPDLKVEGMPAHLQRGQNLVGPGGEVRNVRLKRSLKGEKKTGEWQWRRNLFPAREVNGLRVVMALVNNWDLFDKNNSVYQEVSGGPDHPDEIAMVSDLGASFGTTGRNVRTKGKGDLASYRDSKFITKATSTYVDFAAPSRPMWVYFFSLPEFIGRIRLRWIGKRVPRADVQWVAQWLGQLTPQQIQGAFRGAGYSPEEAEGFAGVVEKRIAELNDLPAK